MAKDRQAPRERAARELCRRDGHPEDTRFEGRPMWESYLPEVGVVLEAALSPEDYKKLLAEEDSK